MAIALDTSTDGGLNPGNSLTWEWNHTCTGSDRILFVNFFGDASDDITGVTYDGIPMTEVGKTQNGADRFCYMYVLHAPSTGLNQVQISASSEIRMAGSSVSYTGAEQTSMVDSSNINDANANNLTTSTTTVADNCWTVLSVRTGQVPVAGAGSTLRESSVSGYGTFDSNAAITPAGLTSMAETTSGVTSHSHVIASFAPVSVVSAVTPTPNLLTLGIG